MSVLPSRRIPPGAALRVWRASWDGRGMGAKGLGVLDAETSRSLMRLPPGMGSSYRTGHDLEEVAG
jgi:hypothetical protein